MPQLQQVNDIRKWPYVAQEASGSASILHECICTINRFPLVGVCLCDRHLECPIKWKKDTDVSLVRSLFIWVYHYSQRNLCKYHLVSVFFFLCVSVCLSSGKFWQNTKHPLSNKLELGPHLFYTHAQQPAGAYSRKLHSHTQQKLTRETEIRRKYYG